MVPILANTASRPAPGILRRLRSCGPYLQSGRRFPPAACQTRHGNVCPRNLLAATPTTGSTGYRVRLVDAGLIESVERGLLGSPSRARASSCAVKARTWFTQAPMHRMKRRRPGMDREGHRRPRTLVLRLEQVAVDGGVAPKSGFVTAIPGRGRRPTCSESAPWSLAMP
ncbi:hypothetical protein ACFFX0_28590 [Citricoccus parietis]|uniref:Uncharacterized protein n=1 Tax=Citricoccus parietis TaxID=592307 RepID=A0ABV5G7J5_9MICC